MLSMVKNVVIKPSPKYMQKRLKAVGLRPINNIVDITNYVLMEIGQPIVYSAKHPAHYTCNYTWLFTISNNKHIFFKFVCFTIKPSPKYIQKRLKAVGLRPINNIVDITNYVLMEIGQPMHSFDLNNAFIPLQISPLFVS